MTIPRCGILQRYSARLPLGDATPRISLGEGGTPLIESLRLRAELSLDALHFKFEGLNPTGSFKDRGMVLAVAHALERGDRTIVCASTGNTSASAAAYGARFGLRTVVVVPRGRIASGKLAQAQIFGAVVLQIEGNFDAALVAVRALADRGGVTLVNSINPSRIDGQKTAAFEIVDELGGAPDVLALPVGNAGNITAYWRGFTEYWRDGVIAARPRLVGGQAAGAAPLVVGAVVTEPATVASAIRIGNPASWASAISARDESEGLIDSVTDEEILAAQRDLARFEGIFCEPASAAAVAIVRRARSDGRIPKGATVVCVLTGTGLKDIDAISTEVTAPRTVSADVNALEEAIAEA